MSRFAWKKEYEIGDELIDSQHRQLLALANALFEAERLGKEKLIVKQAFDALLLYTRQHFRDEEDLFAGRGSPRLEAHRDLHQTLESEVVKMWIEDKTGMAKDIGHKLEDWIMTRLVPHMVEEDQKAAYGKD